MPRADQRLYSALLRAGARFRAERLPLLGAAGTELVAWGLSWPSAARAVLETPPPGAGLAEGIRLLGRLQTQLEVLSEAEDHTREALAEWAALADRFSRQCSSSSRQEPSSSSGSGARFLPFAAAEAVEEGLALLSRQAQELADPLQLDELEEAGEAGDPPPAEDNEPSGSGSSSGGDSSQEPAALTLDELAAEVRRLHPALFPGGSNAAGGGGWDNTASSSSSSSASSLAQPEDLQQQRAAALAGVLYRQQRFRFEPFEWVYEGLQPLLLPPGGRLRRRKLAPITLAAAAAGMGRRLGLPLVPVPAETGDELAAAVAEGPAGGAAGLAGGLPLEQLRPDVAQRYAGRAAAVAPAAGPWVLLGGGRDGAASGSGTNSASQQQQPWCLAMDACTGELLEPAAAQRRFPALQLEGANWGLRAPLTAWQHMVRTLIQAHQRRGESDLVAHWVYVLLALDPQAAEWAHMLEGR